jgi:hypothetical protein
MSFKRAVYGVTRARRCVSCHSDPAEAGNVTRDQSVYAVVCFGW